MTASCTGSGYGALEGGVAEDADDDEAPGGEDPSNEEEDSPRKENAPPDPPRGTRYRWRGWSVRRSMDRIKVSRLHVKSKEP